jgi:mycobactin salicyl-AMP ligase
VLFDVGQAVSASALTEHEAPAGGDVDEKICATAIFGGSPLTLAELNGHLDERGVAAHSRPDVLAPMSTLPTTAVGNVDKKAIVKVLARP